MSAERQQLGADAKASSVPRSTKLVAGSTLQGKGVSYLACRQRIACGQRLAVDVAVAVVAVAVAAAAVVAVAVAAAQPWTEALNYQTTWASTDWSANERGLKWERLSARVEALGQLEALAEPQLGPSADCQVAREERRPVAGCMPMDAAHHPVK